MESHQAELIAKIAKLESELNRVQRERDDLFRKRYALGVLSVYGITLLSIYTMILGVMNHFDIQYHQTIFTTIFSLLFFGTFLFIMVLRMQQPLYLFGFNLNRWRLYAFEAVIYSLLFCGFITLIKWILTRSIYALHAVPLFDFGALIHMGPTLTARILLLAIYAFVYILFVPLQTFIVHSAVQSPIIHFIESKHARILSVTIATIFFVGIHASINLTFALAMAIPGAFWALLYARQQSLVGVMLSHVIVGVYGLYVLGYGHFFIAMQKLF